MYYSHFKDRYPSPGWRLQLMVYVVCMCIGLLFMSRFRFSDTVPLAGDEWEYQSIAVNLLHGHGFPVTKCYEDSTVYKLCCQQGANGKESWHNFYQGSTGHDIYRNPLYPLFISGVYGICGVSPEWLRRVQFLLLLLAGSLLPYICYRMSLPGGMLIGVMAYMGFLFFDHHYAADVMCEAPVVAHAIVFLLAYLALDHRHRISHASILGVLMGIGLLLKNYFLPLFLFIAAYELYLAFISKKAAARSAISLVLGILLAILPWSIYINFVLGKENPGHPIVLITTQGEDVLLGSNNEYSADGHWHPEWSSYPGSFYDRPEIKGHAGWCKVTAFYFHHLSWIPYYFSSKIMMGLFATWSQLIFYLSVMAYVLVYKVKCRQLLLIPVAVLAIVAWIAEGHIHSLLISITDSWLNVHHRLRYPLIAITITALWMYFRIQIRQPHPIPHICWLLLANFALLTLVFYGNSRITGVVDFICLTFAFYNLSEIVTMTRQSRPQSTV